MMRARRCVPLDGARTDATAADDHHGLTGPGGPTLDGGTEARRDAAADEGGSPERDVGVDLDQGDSCTTIDSAKVPSWVMRFTFWPSRW